MIDILGFFPDVATDLFPEQAQLMGQNCARPGEGGQGQGRPEIYDATRECIINFIGYIPEGPEEMTEDQEQIALT